MRKILNFCKKAATKSPKKIEKGEIPLSKKMKELKFIYLKSFFLFPKNLITFYTFFVLLIF